MKKILLAAILFTAVSPVAFSTNIPGTHVVVTSDPTTGIPTAVTKSFESKFPTATNVTWRVVGTPATVVYVADFFQGNTPATVKHLQAAFAADGTFLGKQPV